MARAYTPAVLAALGFTCAYLAAAGAGILSTGNREFFVYFGVVATLVGAAGWLHRRVGFSPAVVWGLCLLGALHMAGGLLRPPDAWPVDGRRVLYNAWVVPGLVRFDHVVHFYGSGVGTWACWQWLRSSARLARPTIGLAAICALAGVGLGAVNEVVEFLTTRIVPDTNVGGFENTGWDLVANLGGATASAVLLVRTGGRAASHRANAPADRPDARREPLDWAAGSRRA